MGQRVAHKHGVAGSLKATQRARDFQVAQLTHDADLLSRHAAITDWQQEVQARVERESADVELQRARRVRADQLAKVDEECSQLRALISRQEERCRQQTLQLNAQRKRQADLQMEERLCASAEQLSQETADQALHHQILERGSLEAQIAKEIDHRRVKAPPLTYAGGDEADVVRQQQLLMSLMDCVRESTRALESAGLSAGGGSSAPVVGDAIERALHDVLQSMKDLGEPTPSVARLAPGRFSIAGDEVVCEIGPEGSLWARLSGTRQLVPIGEFLHSRGRSMPRSSSRSLSPSRRALAAFLPGTAIPPPHGRSLSPGGASGRLPATPFEEALRAISPPRTVPMPSSSLPVVAPLPQSFGTSGHVPYAPSRSWGVPALVAPITVGGGEPLLAV